MVDDLETRLRAMEDLEAIKQLTFKYAYSVDSKQWDDVVDCFANDASLNFSAIGKGTGREYIARFFKEVIPSRNLFTCHIVINPVIEVHGNTAKGRWYFLVPATDRPTNTAVWVGGRYDNEYIKKNGVWKLSLMAAAFFFRTPFDQGWVKKPIL